MPLSAEHKAKMAEGRRAYFAKQKAKKLSKLERWEQKAIVAQGGEPETPNPPVRHSPPAMRHALDFEHMELEQLRQWVTDTRKHWDEAIQQLKQKEQQWASDHTSVACACGCGTVIDLSRGRFASSEAYRDQSSVIQTRYWATQRCVQAYRLAQSPQYKDQLRREMEEKVASHFVKSEVLEG